MDASARTRRRRRTIANKVIERGWGLVNLTPLAVDVRGDLLGIDDRRGSGLNRALHLVNRQQRGPHLLRIADGVRRFGGVLGHYRLLLRGIGVGRVFRSIDSRFPCRRGVLHDLHVPGNHDASTRRRTEDRYVGSMLLTSPVREVEIVVGKFLAAFITVLAMLVLSLYFVIILFVYGIPDVGPILDRLSGFGPLRRSDAGDRIVRFGAEPEPDRGTGRGRRSADRIDDHRLSSRNGSPASVPRYWTPCNSALRFQSSTSTVSVLPRLGHFRRLRTWNSFCRRCRLLPIDHRCVFDADGNRFRNSPMALIRTVDREVNVSRTTVSP